MAVKQASNACRYKTKRQRVQIIENKISHSKLDSCKKIKINPIFQLDSGQQVLTKPSSPSNDKTTLPPNSSGLPSNTTKSLFISSTFNLSILSIFLDTKSTASLLDRPAYFAAHPASIGILWICESPDMVSFYSQIIENMAPAYSHQQLQDQI